MSWAHFNWAETKGEHTDTPVGYPLDAFWNKIRLDGTNAPLHGHILEKKDLENDVPVKSDLVIF